MKVVVADDHCKNEGTLWTNSVPTNSGNLSSIRNACLFRLLIVEHSSTECKKGQCFPFMQNPFEWQSAHWSSSSTYVEYSLSLLRLSLRDLLPEAMVDETLPAFLYLHSMHFPSLSWIPCLSSSSNASLELPVKATSLLFCSISRFGIKQLQKPKAPANSRQKCQSPYQKQQSCPPSEITLIDANKVG